jgi:hypothetical protein
MNKINHQLGLKGEVELREVVLEDALLMMNQNIEERSSRMSQMIEIKKTQKIMACLMVVVGDREEVVVKKEEVVIVIETVNRKTKKETHGTTSRGMS